MSVGCAGFFIGFVSMCVCVCVLVIWLLVSVLFTSLLPFGYSYNCDAVCNVHVKNSV